MDLANILEDNSTVVRKIIEFPCRDNQFLKNTYRTFIVTRQRMKIRPLQELKRKEQEGIKNANSTN